MRNTHSQNVNTEDTTHDFTWKPESGKPRGSTNPVNRITISSREEYNEKLEGNDLEFSFV